MKKITLLCLLCLCFWDMNGQCTIDPFIQQNYEFDAKLLVLREIKGNASDPDYDNPFLVQSRVNSYLEKFSAIYTNPQNLADVDSIFNEFQFKVNATGLAFKKMEFRVPTSTSWVDNLKNSQATGVTALDDFLAQYQFSTSSFFDHTSGTYAGLTKFEITTAYDFLNTYALLDDLQNTSSDITEVVGNVVDLSFWCNYIGVPYTVQAYQLPPNDVPVSSCEIIVDNATNNDTVFRFVLGRCFASGTYIPDSRFVTVSNDCSFVTFSRTLSNEDFELTNVSVYPNPASNSIHIQGIDNIQTVEIHSIIGKQMHVSLSNSQIDISRLKSGVYFLKITDDQNRFVIKKIIKK
ncbi:T9SS type A sorting domain-containing protein [Kordia sp. TARA_039_SRF]|nr:T9SS type A sorting domain-containing protein [Kordia sp. TARA_039_SRF]